MRGVYKVRGERTVRWFKDNWPVVIMGIFMIITYAVILGGPSPGEEDFDIDALVVPLVYVGIAGAFFFIGGLYADQWIKNRYNEMYGNLLVFQSELGRGDREFKFVFYIVSYSILAIGTNYQEDFEKYRNTPEFQAIMEEVKFRQEATVLQQQVYITTTMAEKAKKGKLVLDASAVPDEFKSLGTPTKKGEKLEFLVDDLEEFKKRKQKEHADILTQINAKIKQVSKQQSVNNESLAANLNDGKTFIYVAELAAQDFLGAFEETHDLYFTRLLLFLPAPWEECFKFAKEQHDVDDRRVWAFKEHANFTYMDALLEHIIVLCWEYSTISHKRAIAVALDAKKFLSYEMLALIELNSKTEIDLAQTDKRIAKREKERDYWFTEYRDLLMAIMEMRPRTRFERDIRSEAAEYKDKQQKSGRRKTVGIVVSIVVVIVLCIVFVTLLNMPLEWPEAEQAIAAIPKAFVQQPTEVWNHFQV